MAESKRRSSKKVNVEDIAETAKAIVTDKAEEIKEFVTEKAAQVGHDIKKYSAQGTKKVVNSVKKEPLKAVGIAAAVGAVFGFIFRHKKKK